MATITALSLAHHVDHVVRGVTGWPFEGGFNPFSASLFAYPLIALGLVLTARELVGPRFWAVLAGGGALFVALVHVGPVAGDDVATIPDSYDSTLADVLVLVLLGGFVAALVAHCAHEVGQWRGHPDQSGALSGGRSVPKVHSKPSGSRTRHR